MFFIQSDRMHFKSWIKLHFQLFCFVLIIRFSQSANVLFLFGGGNLSHKLSIWPLAVALADRGHNVTFVSSSPDKATEHPGITDLAPQAFQALTAQVYHTSRVKERLEGTYYGLAHPTYDEASLSFCEVTLKMVQSDGEPAFHDLVKNKHFDLVILNILYNECALLLTHHFGAKSIIFSSTTGIPWFHGLYGVPMEASWIPARHLGGGLLSHPMSFWARMRNLYTYVQGYSQRDSLGTKLLQMYKSAFGLSADHHVPGLEELERSCSLVFINTHHAVDMARSIPPFFVNIGGMSAWSPIGELSDTYKEFMDGAEQGVILLTLGSTIPLNTLPNDFVSIFFEAVRQFDRIRFIWRWEGEMPSDAPNNIMASKWVPQLEILSHPKTLAFMTHGGLNSVIEATYCGVPLIVLPVFADQDYNAYRIQAQELGTAVEFKDLSLGAVTTALHQVITNPKYKRNMLSMSRIFKDRPQSPIETAIYWTEFVLRHDDTSALKPMLLEQPWYTRGSFDVFFVSALFLTLLPLIAVFLIQRAILRQTNSQQVEK